MVSRLRRQPVGVGGHHSACRCLLVKEEEMNETLLQSATDAADMLSRKEVSSRELTEMLFGRIDEINPAVNAVVELRREAALREAAVADEAITHGVRGPLHGLPMTIKESFNVAGLHTTWGNLAFKDYVADTDATVVRRLKQAGAIIVGKTNVHFMLADFGQTANDLYASPTIRGIRPAPRVAPPAERRRRCRLLLVEPLRAGAVRRRLGQPVKDSGPNRPQATKTAMAR
jgi:hypothetical protein